MSDDRNTKPQGLEDCQFTQTDDHEWHCDIHDVEMVGASVEPVGCSIWQTSVESGQLMVADDMGDPVPAASNFERYTDEWIDARSRELAQGDSNDEEIDTLRDIVEHLQTERAARQLQGSYLLGAIAREVATANDWPPELVEKFVEAREADGGRLWETHVTPLLDGVANELGRAVADGEFDPAEYTVAS